MTAPRPEAEAVEIVDAIFDEIDLHAHGAPPCEADCACCAEIRQDWIKRLDAALSAARADEREKSNAKILAQTCNGPNGPHCKCNACERLCAAIRAMEGR